jgi:hypothetical protein
MPEEISLTLWIGLATLLVAIVGVIYAIKSHYANKSSSTLETNQASLGEQSPNINSKGKVNIRYGTKDDN